jgi:hypothetical protein
MYTHMYVYTHARCSGQRTGVGVYLAGGIFLLIVGIV